MAGASRKETLTQTIKYKMNLLNNAFLPPEGESLNMVERRVVSWLEPTLLYNHVMSNWYAAKKCPWQIAIFLMV